MLALAAVVAALVPATCGHAPPFHPGPLGAVAYVRDEAVHVVDVSSRRDRVVAHLWVPNYEGGVSWSGDGRWLAVGDDLVPAAGGRLCRPFPNGTGRYGDDPSLVWSPKGELLAATTAKGVFLLRPGGTPRRFLPAGWSADGFGPGGGRIAAGGPLRAFELWSVVWSSPLGYRLSTGLGRLGASLAGIAGPGRTWAKGRELPRLGRRYRDER